MVYAGPPTSSVLRWGNFRSPLSAGHSIPSLSTSPLGIVVVLLLMSSVLGGTGGGGIWGSEMGFGKLVWGISVGAEREVGRATSKLLRQNGKSSPQVEGHTQERALNSCSCDSITSANTIMCQCTPFQQFPSDCFPSKHVQTSSPILTLSRTFFSNSCNRSQMLNALGSRMTWVWLLLNEANPNESMWNHTPCVLPRVEHLALKCTKAGCSLLNQ